MTVLEVIQRSADFLAKKNVESPRLQVELMLAHVLQMARMKLYLNFERVLTETEMEKLREMVKRRGQREPLQHIVGATNFCGLEFLVNGDVLIPRPETELLAERAWKFLQERTEKGERIEALDFGTGSGCLAVILAAKCPQAEIHALDISAEALEIARANAARHNVSERIQFYNSDAFTALDPQKKFALIVANPPYIPTKEIPTLEPEVRDHDPQAALDGGMNGLKFFELLAKESSMHLEREGKLMLEFGEGQAEPVRKIFEKGNWTVEAVEKDLTGRERFLIAACPGK